MKPEFIITITLRYHFVHIQSKLYLVEKYVQKVFYVEIWMGLLKDKHVYTAMSFEIAQSLWFHTNLLATREYVVNHSGII